VTRLMLRLRPAAAVMIAVGLTTGLFGALPAVAQTGDPSMAGTGWVMSPRTPKRHPIPPTVSYPVEQGLTARTIALHRAALEAWPQITTYYGYRNDPSSDHYSGRALDLMIPSYTTSSGRALGDQVAAWAVANAAGFGLDYVIWDQHIWSVRRADEGWRLMADRGSDSANHKNHVHVSVVA